MHECGPDVTEYGIIAHAGPRRLAPRRARTLVGALAKVDEAKRRCSAASGVPLPGSHIELFELDGGDGRLAEQWLVRDGGWIRRSDVEGPSHTWGGAHRCEAEKGERDRNIP